MIAFIDWTWVFRGCAGVSLGTWAAGPVADGDVSSVTSVICLGPADHLK